MAPNTVADPVFAGREGGRGEAIPKVGVLTFYFGQIPSKTFMKTKENSTTEGGVSPASPFESATPKAGPWFSKIFSCEKAFVKLKMVGWRWGHCRIKKVKFLPFSCIFGGKIKVKNGSPILGLAPAVSKFLDPPLGGTTIILCMSECSHK